MRLTSTRSCTGWRSRSCRLHHRPPARAKPHATARRRFRVGARKLGTDRRADKSPHVGEPIEIALCSLQMSYDKMRLTSFPHSLYHCRPWASI